MAKTYNPAHADISPAARLAALGAGEAVDLGEYRVIRATHQDRPVFFAVRNAMDAIQKHHIEGAFYETEELDIIRRHFAPGETFIDLGANVGNHALYVAMYLEPAKVLCVEPNSLAYENLLANIVLNGVEETFDLSWLGFGVSCNVGDGFGITHWVHNLGGGKLIPRDGGTISLRSGDDILADTKADFIKIDVEGMEMDVLTSLENTVARDRPKIFVEVDNENRDAVLAWVDTHGYTTHETFKRYRDNENFLFVPESESET
ncbi:FkbM family methyltransferase [Jannaschia sp. CCS1]|uniref:FkbM family methyltransferase n=1 Tax=Jannaschia sp. (strain CCS1) TaxID=290400 RepID=UPI00006C0048|nr:FkbM family methyltransferase [Jannaschia sp. CCS1]ABD55277.1 Methyltransferase FkbM [Jannaschia sp. CCS1]